MTAIKYKKVAEVCEIIMGQSPSSDTYNDRKEGLPFFQGKADFGKLHPTPKTYCSAPLKVANENDILMSVRAPVGDVNIANTKCCIGRGLAAIRANNDMINYKYLFYALNYKKNEIESMGTGSTFKAISKKDIESIQIPVFDIENQVKIVKALDKAQELIDKRKAQIEALDQLTQSVFLEMFGDWDKNEKAWEVVSLESITNHITDGVHSKPEYTNDGIPFISVKDINTGKLKFENCKFISEETHQEYIRRCKPELGDILYTKVGATYGIPAIVDTDKEFSLYVSVALIKPKRHLVNSVYLREALRSIWVKRQADRSIKGIGVPDLHLKEIKKFKIILPPLDVQEEFAKLVQKVEKQRELLEKGIIEL